jgi:hypothetical protein
MIKKKTSPMFNLFKATFSLNALGRTGAAKSRPTAVRLPGWNRICVGLTAATRMVSHARRLDMKNRGGRKIRKMAREKSSTHAQKSTV